MGSFHQGVFRVILHSPYYDRVEWRNLEKFNVTRLWSDHGNLNGSYISFSMIRQPGWPHGWMQRASARCCSCGDTKAGDLPTVAHDGLWAEVVKP
jgi:hypothetical protein